MRAGKQDKPLEVEWQIKQNNCNNENKVLQTRRSSVTNERILTFLAIFLVTFMAPLRVTIVGAGLTGSLTASRLKRVFKDDVEVTVLEKSRGAGGRMNTSRCPENPKLTCDLGAQYISATPEYAEKHKDFYDELLKAGVLREFTGKIVGPNRFGGTSKHFVAPQGINSVVKHFLKKEDINPEYERTVNKIDLKADKESYTLHMKEIDKAVTTDALVLTIPAPQLMKLQGNIQNLLEPWKTNLEKVVYSSRYAMGLYFDGLLDVPWDCKYVGDNDCIRFIGIDNAKRGVGFDHGYSVVVHTSVPFGLKHLEDNFDQVEPVIMQNLKQFLPSLPEPISTKFLKWRYSQIYKPYPGSPCSLVLNNSPLLIAGGDSFCQSNFDGCIDSSSSVMEYITKFITAKT